MTAARRQLRFASLDEAVRDAEHLLSVGYDKTKNWDLAQCCGHLADWVEYPMIGFPKAPLPIRLMLWVSRNTIAPRGIQKALDTGVMGEGLPTVPQSVHPPDGDPAAAVARFKGAVERLHGFTGELHPSPLAGTMDKPTVERLHAVHAAHHLSFLVPKG